MLSVLRQNQVDIWLSNQSFTVDWNTISGNSISSTDHYEGAALDGDKALCLDTLYKDIINNNCFIYSFGLSDDWTFEENMANLGCTV